MATSSKTRRKTPDPAAQAPATPAANPAATPAAARTPARKAPARKRAAAAAPSAAPAAAEAAAATKPAAKQKPAARKAAATPGTVAAEPVMDALPEVKVPKPVARKAAAKKAPAKKAAAKQAPAKKAAARKTAPKPTAPAVTPVAEEPVIVADAPAVQAAPVPEPSPVAETPAPAAAVAQAPAEPSAGVADAEAEAPASTDRPERSRRNRRRKSAPVADSQVQATAEAVLAVLAAPAAVAVDAPPEVQPEPEPPAPPTGPAHSQIVVLPGDAVRIAWQPGHACPPALKLAAQRRCDDAGLLSPEDDGALPQLLRLAQEGGHTLQVDDAVWTALAAHRDARHRLGALEAAYPDGPASAALQRLLRVPLPPFQAEGALFAVIAGRALIADERGLGKTAQAIAAAQLWRRHFGVQRVLVLCAPAQRAAWQRAWRRLAGLGEAEVQVIDGSHHQRAAQWSAPAGVRMAAPEALQTDAALLAHWAPDLVIIDEPQQLALHAADWTALAAAPHALVLSGAPLADLPELMDGLVAWLDTARLGPLAALRELQAASRGDRQLGEDDVERLSGALSRLMLQRQRDDVADQLPPVVHSERLLPLAPGQRAAHDSQAAVARRLLAGWQASGWCSDSDQWRLAQALRGMQDACHRADPGDPASPLAEATVQALAATLDDLAGTGAPRAAVLCASAADRDQLGQRLADHTGAAGVPLLLPGEHLPGGIDVVLQAGVPWRPRRSPGGPRGEAPAGQQWLYLVAQDGIDCGLFDTLAARLDLPRSPADASGGGARGWLQGEALQQWLTALQLALAATPTVAG